MSPTFCTPSRCFGRKIRGGDEIPPLPALNWVKKKKKN